MGITLQAKIEPVDMLLPVKTNQQKRPMWMVTFHSKTIAVTSKTGSTSSYPACAIEQGLLMSHSRWMLTRTSLMLLRHFGLNTFPLQGSLTMLSISWYAFPLSPSSTLFLTSVVYIVIAGMVHIEKLEERHWQACACIPQGPFCKQAIQQWCVQDSRIRRNKSI